MEACLISAKRASNQEASEKTSTANFEGLLLATGNAGQDCVSSGASRFTGTVCVTRSCQSLGAFLPTAFPLRPHLQWVLHLFSPHVLQGPRICMAFSPRLKVHGPPRLTMPSQILRPPMAPTRKGRVSRSPPKKALEPEYPQDLLTCVEPWGDLEVPQLPSTTN